MPILLFKTGIRKNNHVIGQLIDEVLKGAAIVDIRRVAVPTHNQPQMMEHIT
jgi:hypothetical protein